ncbi:MAG: hypothetical protein R2707_17590 [Acidimicrobiales bacterium]
MHASTRTAGAILVTLLMAGACGSDDVEATPLPTSASTSTTTLSGEDTSTDSASPEPGTDDDGASDASTDPTDEVDAVTLCTAAPRSTTTLIPSPPWSDGVARTLELRIGREDSRRELPDGLSRTPVQLTVEDDDGDGWTFLWAAEPTLLDDLGIPAELLDEAAPLLAEVPPQRIRYRIGGERAWLGVTNPDEVRQAALDTIDILGEIIPAEDLALEQTRQLFAGMPDEALTQIFAEEPQVLHSLEGIELAVDEVLEFRDLLPNTLGGEPFPATTTIEILDLVDDDGCVAIQVRVVPDAEAFIPILMESLRQAFPATATDTEIEDAAESFEIENLILGQYDYASGYFRSVTATQRISDGTSERVDTKIISDVTD